MLMLRSTHEAALQTLRQEHAMHLSYKDSSRADMVKAHHYLVSTLEQQVADLKRLVFTPQNQDVPAHLEEADRVITQNDRGTPLPSEFSEAELKEQDQIFSGTWDEVVTS